MTLSPGASFTATAGRDSTSTSALPHGFGGKELSAVDLGNLAAWVAGAALGVLLEKRGWRAEAYPGRPVVVRRGE
ncbi:MAG TPA: hypothetical protein VGR38_06585 [Candidatus Polarisedimenticolia bacterium]|nr:hypothetical protein [Candidatus Polarisedimenticolia bacterium]